VTIHSPSQATHLGIAYVPEDRREYGLVMPMNIAANITLPMLETLPDPVGLSNSAPKKLPPKNTASGFRSVPLTFDW